MKKIFKFKKSIYSKEALLKAAYEFVQCFYVHLDEDEESFIVTVESKHPDNIVTADEFKNQLLIQETRKLVAEKTGNLREIIYARAMASTIIAEPLPEKGSNESCEKDILIDWFEKYE